MTGSLPQAGLYKLAPLLSPQNFRVRLLRNFRDSFSFGLGWAPSLFLLIGVMLLHLALMLMKIGFVNSRRSDLKRFDVARPTLHYFSFLLLKT